MCHFPIVCASPLHLCVRACFSRSIIIVYWRPLESVVIATELIFLANSVLLTNRVNCSNFGATLCLERAIFASVVNSFVLCLKCHWCKEWSKPSFLAACFYMISIIYSSALSLPLSNHRFLLLCPLWFPYHRALPPPWLAFLLAFRKTSALHFTDQIMHYSSFSLRLLYWYYLLRIIHFTSIPLSVVQYLKLMAAHRWIILSE